MALLEDALRSATIVAAEPATCLTLRKERFQQELAAHPAIAVSMVFEVSRRLRDTLDVLDANT
jgi:CRP-like cAMP-binding protein